MSDKPKISIITVVYNGEQFLEETIQSVINQTYDNIEYIIIDGGSTDGTVDIIKQYADKISYWVSEEDKGIYDAMNKGINVATGDFINFMNGGDAFSNNKVIKDIFCQNANINKTIVYGKVALFYKNKFINYYGNNKIIPHQGAFFNADVMKKLNFNQDYKVFADGECLIRIQKLKEYKVYFVDMAVANFELGGIGNHPKYFFKRLKEELKLRKQYNTTFSLKWYLLKFIDFFGYIIYALLGLKFYYNVFQKNLLNKINK